MVGNFRIRIRKAVELERIANLYDTESGEYFVKSRKELVRALQSEIERDTRSEDATRKGIMGQGDASASSAEESLQKRRMKMFELTFVSPGRYTTAARSASSSALTPAQDEATQTEVVNADEEVSGADNEDKSKPQEEQSLDIPSAPVSNHSADGNNGEGEDKQVSDIEARLASFESTMPSALKTDEERVRDLNVGLKGLGYHLPTSSDIKRHISIHTPKPMTDEEHIRRIVEMAKDEARLEGAGVDEDGVQAALGLLVGSGVVQCGNTGVANEDALVINDQDDLATVIQRAHLNAGAGEMSKSSIADMFADAAKVREEAGGVGNLTQTGKILNLIANAQEHLFEASAHLGGEEDDASVGDDSDAYGDNGMLIPDTIFPLATTGMVQGKISIAEAKKCVDEILRTWSKSNDGRGG